MERVGDRSQAADRAATAGCLPVPEDKNRVDIAVRESRHILRRLDLRFLTRRPRHPDRMHQSVTSRHSDSFSPSSTLKCCPRRRLRTPTASSGPPRVAPKKSATAAAPSRMASTQCSHRRSGRRQSHRGRLPLGSRQCLPETVQPTPHLRAKRPVAPLATCRLASRRFTSSIQQSYAAATRERVAFTSAGVCVGRVG